MAAKELTDGEMSEIQEVMFTMGMAGDFTSHVSKTMSGKKFYQDLAREIEKFLDHVIQSDKFSGVMGLIDLFCLYNRARGTDLVSPEDVKIACETIHASSTKYCIKFYQKSGLRTIQLKSFNETAYFQKLALLLADHPGMTADKLATHLKINLAIIKEHIAAAEQAGFICVDESDEGLRYHSNTFGQISL